MKNKKKKKWNASIEIPGYTFVITLFLSIWIDEFRWKLFFTSIFFLFIAVLNSLDKWKKEKEEKKK